MARPTILLAALVSASVLAGSVVGYSSAGSARSEALPRATPTFVVSGRGWGHGVGMCQVGAFGMALDGATYEEILKKYYKGIELRKLY